MDVDDDDSVESEYRLRIGKQVKYLTIAPGTFDRDTLSFPSSSLPPLPKDTEWTMACISRGQESRDLRAILSNRALAGVKCSWHQTRNDCLELQRTAQLTSTAYEATLHSDLLAGRPSTPVTVVVKAARFEWEVARIGRETRAYQLLGGTGVASRFLAHVHENGRIMGFLLEKVEGRSASIQDLKVCEGALGRLHELGLVHGDVKWCNFLVQEKGAQLIDFECTRESVDGDLMCKELETLRTELVDESNV